LVVEGETGEFRRVERVLFAFGEKGGGALREELEGRGIRVDRRERLDDPRTAVKAASEGEDGVV
jgi:hypothetical protein